MYKLYANLCSLALALSISYNFSISFTLMQLTKQVTLPDYTFLEFLDHCNSRQVLCHQTWIVDGM